MFLVRRSRDRGHVAHGWLDTFHTFSFANYYDPEWMGFGPLRVINEDRIAATSGFDEHAHHDMEILTYVIEGSLQHRDDLGNGSIIRPDQIQYMSAGSGILHSEFNPADTPVHLLQIWIEPNVIGAAPRYEERELPRPSSSGLRLLASADGREDSIAIRQDARVFRGIFDAGHQVGYALGPGRRVWIQVISGTLTVGAETVGEGDACGIEHETHCTISAVGASHFLLFDLP